MSEYYGIQSPSSDFMAHYGIKGMKWGVRKAIEKGNTKSLDKHYKKAAKKLEKLSQRTDIELQNKKAKRYGRLAYAGAAVTAGSLGGIVGSSMAVKKHLGKIGELNAAHNVLGEQLRKNDSALIKDATRRLRLTAQGGKHNSYRHSYERDLAFDRLSKDFESASNKNWNDYKNKSDALKKQLDSHSKSMDKAQNVGKIATIAGGIGLLGASIASGKALKAKYRTTAKGHAKAVADRDAWRNQMAETFKGTKYANLPSVPKKKKRR